MGPWSREGSIPRAHPLGKRRRVAQPTILRVPHPSWVCLGGIFAGCVMLVLRTMKVKIPTQPKRRLDGAPDVHLLSRVLAWATRQIVIQEFSILRWRLHRLPKGRREIEKALRVFYYWRISAATSSPNFSWIYFWVSGSKSVKSNIRRTSTISLSFPGMREAHSSASSRDFTWMIQ